MSSGGVFEELKAEANKLSDKGITFGESVKATLHATTARLFLNSAEERVVDAIDRRIELMQDADLEGVEWELRDLKQELVGEQEGEEE